MIKSDFRVTRVSGGSLVDFPPVISFDGEYILIGAKEGSIFIFSAKTGAPLGVLKEENELLGFDTVRGSISSHVVAAYLTAGSSQTRNAAKLVLWDYTTGEKLQKARVRSPSEKSQLRGFIPYWSKPLPKFLFKVFNPGPKNVNNECAVFEAIGVVRVPVFDGAGDGEWDLARCLWSNDHCEMGKGRVLYEVQMDGNSVVGSPNFDFIAGISVRGLSVYNVKRQTSLLHTVGDRCLTSIAAHPYAAILATGDITGRVTIWNDIFSQHPVRSFHHWHNNPLKCLQYSSEGTSLISGGLEMCVVKTRIEDHKSEFISQFDSPIVQIAYSPDSTFFVTGHSDNGVRLISPDRQIIGIIQGLTYSFSQGKDDPYYPAGINFDPRSKGIVLNGVPGHVQFCALDPFRLLYNFDVTNQNYAVEERERTFIQTEVQMVRISEPDGEWMATVEGRVGTVYSQELRVKFWKWNSKSKNYALNTTMELPEARYVIGIEFQPVISKNKNQRMVALATGDKQFKILALCNALGNYSDAAASPPSAKLRWQCVDKMCFENDMPTCVAFSFDGSVLAVSYKRVVTLWNVDPLLLRCRIQWPYSAIDSGRDETFDPVGHVLFGRYTCEHLLMAASSKKIVCWSLLDMRPLWCVGLDVVHFFADPGSLHCAVVTAKNRFYVFKPSDPMDKKIFDHRPFKSVVRDNKHVADHVSSACFLPPALSFPDASVSFGDSSLNSKPPSDIVYLTRNRDVFRISSVGSGEDQTDAMEIDDSGADADRSKNVPKLAPIVNPLTPFGRLVTEKRATQDEDGGPGDKGARDGVDFDFLAGKGTRDFLNKFLVLPSHSLPGMSALCKGFVEAVLADSRPQVQGSRGERRLQLIPEIDADEENDAESGEESDSEKNERTDAREEKEDKEEEEKDRSEYDGVPLIKFKFMRKYFGVDSREDPGCSESVGT